MLGLFRFIPETFFNEFAGYFAGFEPGLFPRFFALRLFVDWFWFVDWLFGFQFEPVEITLVR